MEEKKVNIYTVNAKNAKKHGGCFVWGKKGRIMMRDFFFFLFLGLLFILVLSGVVSGKFVTVN